MHLQLHQTSFNQLILFVALAVLSLVYSSPSDTKSHLKPALPSRTFSNQNSMDQETDKSQRIRQIIFKESRGYDITSPNNTSKRSDYLSWDDYFLAVAYLSAQRSKDPHPSKNSTDGACIVDPMGRIVGIGYDGFPRGCSDDCLPWASNDVTAGKDGGEEELPWLHTREPFLCHAEINAILNKCSNDVVGGRMFVPNFPCKYLCSDYLCQLYH
jgi:deoxycytidylate deaminase